MIDGMSRIRRIELVSRSLNHSRYPYLENDTTNGLNLNSDPSDILPFRFTRVNTMPQ